MREVVSTNPLATRSPVPNIYLRYVFVIERERVHTSFISHGGIIIHRIIEYVEIVVEARFIISRCRRNGY